MNEYEGYKVFLAIELARCAGLIPIDLEYDITWEEGSRLLSMFESSGFDDPNANLYQALEAFFSNQALMVLQQGI